MDVFKSYATDSFKEQHGVWRDVDDARLLVARSGNKAYARLLGAAVEANSQVLDLKNDAADEMSDKIMIDVMANTVLLGWEKLEWKGEVKEYSKVNAKLFLSVKDFRLLVGRLSNEIEFYKTAQEAVTEKN